MCKRQLFGGTILCAGLIGGTAAAQDFVFSNSDVSLGAWANYSYGGPIYNGFNGAGPWSVTLDDQGIATADSSGSASTIWNATSSDAYGGAYAYDVSSFSVTADTLADASWDFSGDFFGYSYMVLDNLTDGVNLLTEFFGAGSTLVTLEAGKDYALRTAVWSTGGGTGSSFTSLLIPAPGAAALFGCAGLLATRRRR